MSELPANQQALAYRERQVRLGKLAVLLAVAGGIATLVGVGLAIEDPAAGPLLAALVGLVALVVGALLANRVLATVRYRISTPNAAGWLAGKLSGAVGLFVAVAVVAEALDVPSAPRQVLVAVLVAGFGWLVADHTARTVLFQADATGVRFGRTIVPWPVVGQFVVAFGTRPGTAEIGLSPAPGAHCPAGQPVAGAVLADLPLSVVVEAAKLHQARLTWAISQSGRTDIEVIVRDSAASPTPAGEQQPVPNPPPPANDENPATDPPRPVHGQAALAAPPAPIHGQAAVGTPPAPVYGQGFVAAPPMPQGAAGPRDRRMWWAAATGIVLVVAAVAAIVVVASGTSTEQARPDVQTTTRYSAKSVSKACDVVDVYVMKDWSTEQRIATEQNIFNLESGDNLSCSAFSDAQYTTGRFVHLNLEITVANNETAAAAEYQHPTNPDFWNVDGDVTEHGKVSDLGTAAEYKSSIATFGNTTRTTYALRVRDGNLALLMRFQSDVDQTDGAGVTVDTLAETAAAQARGAMRELSDTPPSTQGTHRPDPGQVPANVAAASAAKTTGPLMARVRAVDPCELLDRKLPSEFGTPQVTSQQAQGFDECQLAAGQLRFNLDVVEALTKEERAKLVADKLGDREVFHDEDVPGSNGCVYYLPYDTTGFGARIDVVQLGQDPNGDSPPWPEACATTKEYATQLAPRLDKLPARTTPAPEPTLAGKDPCAIVDDLMSTLDDWEASPVRRLYSVECRFDIRQGDEIYQIELDFDRDAEQVGDEPVTIGGLSGVRFPSPDVGMCSVSLVYVPETTPDTWDAQNIGVSVSRDNAGPTGALDPCAVTTTAAEAQIGAL